MAGSPSREALIRQLSRKYTLDPDAVVSIASVEGRNALHGGNSVGDNGTSFGPFQLHANGALPAAVWARGPAFANKWANSKAGLEYAVSRMTAAQGLTGHAAVQAISQHFERPADVAGEVTKAWSLYGKTGGSPTLGASPGPRILAGAGAGRTPLAGPDPRQAITATLLQASTDAVNGKMPDFNGILAIAQARQQQQAAQEQYGTQGQHTGPLAPTSAPGNFNGKVKFIGDTSGINPRFLSRFSRAAAYAGATQIRVISGYRSPEHNAAIGGASHSQHTVGNALDSEALVNGRWVPTGTLLKNTAPKFGLRSGDQPGFFNGRPDPNHVDGL